MVVDLQVLAEEIALLEEQSISTDNIRISNRATISFPFNVAEDTWEEQRLSKNAFGSTKRGIAPAYSDRALKKAIQIGTLFHPREFERALQGLVSWKELVARHLYNEPGAVSYEKMLEWAYTHFEKLKHCVCNTTTLLESCLASGKKVIFEAQLGALRDLYFGVYPFTTSSCTLASFAPIGGGLFSASPDRIVGVMKAFSTCVGAGPFVTEMHDDVAHTLRETAYEYGATTGRPRRIGHLDIVASKYGAQIQGTTEIALTKLDSLTGCSPLYICEHYEYNGSRIDEFPANITVLEESRPIYKQIEGWQEDISACRRFADLPKNARHYVTEIEQHMPCPIRYISVGPKRDMIIDRRSE